MLEQLDKYININRDKYRVRGRDMVGGSFGEHSDDSFIDGDIDADDNIF